MTQGRLLGIIYYLLGNGHAIAPALAEKFEVSIRTIYRDVDRLSSVGIPIYCNPGKGGGIFYWIHLYWIKVYYRLRSKKNCFYLYKAYKLYEKKIKY